MATKAKATAAPKNDETTNEGTKALAKQEIRSVSADRMKFIREQAVGYVEVAAEVASLPYLVKEDALGRECYLIGARKSEGNLGPQVEFLVVMSDTGEEGIIALSVSDSRERWFNLFHGENKRLSVGPVRLRVTLMTSGEWEGNDFYEFVDFDAPEADNEYDIAEYREAKAKARAEKEEKKAKFKKK